MAKFKIGDIIKGKSVFTRTPCTGKIINIDYDSLCGSTYQIKTESGTPWLKDYTVERVEETTHYEKLMKFIRENEIKLADLNDVAENLDELENLEFEIQDTKDLIEETEEELQRLYEELSELEDERNELLN